MTLCKPQRALLFLFAGSLLPAFLTQCTSTTPKTYKDVSYDPAKLKTPTGHGLERDDYPFDESGAYRKDWVKNNTKGRDRSASKQEESQTSLASTESASPGGTSGSTSYPTYSEASASRASGNFVGPAEGAGASNPVPVESSGASASGGTVLASTPAPVKTQSTATRYHKVSSGDTLFSLAGRYKTSVAEIKRVNGLSGDSIRSGQSLRIP
ncbi:MAG TPA: LysM peptidoglycan-binding domain-containing protein [Verrucomicrobiales bacterium]|jgi:LysM repeat protein|nr:LysM peptidoglycan-binding domain-containing protein [Verrucomicrobiales bacterium]